MTTAFNLTIDTLIEKALRWAGGQPSQYEELLNAKDSLSLLLSAWSTKNINLWKVEEVVLPVTAGTTEITLDSSIIRTIACAFQYGTDSFDVGMKPMSHKDYIMLPNKAQVGRPTQYLQERLRDNAKLRLWPVPNQDSTLTMWVIKKFDDVTGYFDNPDVPSRFLTALTFGLAYFIGLERTDGSDAWERKLTRIKQEYDVALQEASNEDTDGVDLKFVPRKNV